jgi:HEAT repeat protein
MNTLCRFALACILVGLSGSVWGQDVRVLTQQLGDRDPSVRRKAASALVDLGPEARAAVPALTKALSDKDTYVRRFAAQALGKIGAPARSAVPALTKALKDEKKEVAEAAAEALGQIRSVQGLADTVKDKGADVSVRRKAIEALADLGPQAKSAVPVLINALKDREVRVQAAEALGAIGPDAKEAIPALKTASELKGGRNRDIRQAATKALKQIQSK